MLRAFASLGQNCCAASWLQEQGLRTQSLLFDWTRCPLPAAVAVLERGLGPHLASILAGGCSVEYPHHSPADFPGYRERCARRFFDTLEHADDLWLAHCAPRPPRTELLLAAEAAVSRLRRGPFRVLALHGYAGGPEKGIIGELVVSPRVVLVTVAADKEFETNRMHGPLYDRLAEELLPATSRGELYRSSVCEEDPDPLGVPPPGSRRMPP